MNSFAILKGEKYTYVNKIKNIITNETAVLCKDECGKFYFCCIDEWVNNRPVEINTADKTQVNKYSTPKQKIELLKSLFCGRTDVYAKRYYNAKTGKSGYVPACSNEWVKFVCNKKKYTCSKCPNRSFIEINDRVIYNHLKGNDEFCRDVVGIYPMLSDETTKFLAIDFDEESWQEDVTALNKRNPIILTERKEHADLLAVRYWVRTKTVTANSLCMIMHSKTLLLLTGELSGMEISIS